MAKELYIPVNGFSKKTSKFYAPVNGFSKEIVKAYCSVNGFSKLFYEKGGGGGGTGFWLFYETLANKVCQNIWGRTFFKTQNGIAFYAIVLDTTNGWVNPFFASTDENGVYYTSNVGGSGTHGSYVYNNETWYWDGFGYGFQNPTSYSPVDSLIKFYSGGQSPAIAAELVLNTLLPRVYSNDFAEDYQVGQTYNLRLGNIEKTIRKAIGVFLFKFVSMKGTVAYDTLLANVDTVVDNILNRCESGGYDKILINIAVSSSSLTMQAMMTNLSIDSSTAYPQITYRINRNGYDFVGTNSFVKPQYQINHVFNNNGMTINEQTLTPSYNSYIIGMRVESDSVGSSNIGLNL